MLSHENNFHVWSKCLLFAQVTDGFPVVFMDGKPLTVSRANIDVHWTEVIIFLMS